MPTSSNQEILTAVRGMAKDLGKLSTGQAVQTEQIKNLVEKLDGIQDSTRGAHKKITSLEKSRNKLYGVMLVVGGLASTATAKVFGFISNSS